MVEFLEKSKREERKKAENSVFGSSRKQTGQEVTNHRTLTYVRRHVISKGWGLLVLRAHSVHNRVNNGNR